MIDGGMCGNNALCVVTAWTGRQAESLAASQVFKVWVPVAPYCRLHMGAARGEGAPVHTRTHTDRCVCTVSRENNSSDNFPTWHLLTVAVVDHHNCIHVNFVNIMCMYVLYDERQGSIAKGVERS